MAASAIYSEFAPQAHLLDLRKANQHDFMAIKAMYMHPHAICYLAGNSDKDFKVLFNERISSGTLYVLECDGEVVASATLSEYRWQCKHVTSLSGIVVKADLKGQGIGTELLNRIENVARKNGIKRLELEVDCDNPSAIFFYKKMGFEKEGIKRGYVKRLNEEFCIDEFVMGKLLDPSMEIKSTLATSQPSPIDLSALAIDDLTLRKATPDDFVQIKPIYRGDHALAFLYGNTDDDFTELFSERIAPKEGISGLYVLEKEKEIVATVNLSRYRWSCEHVLHIGGLAVKQERQGDKIGKKLLKHIELISSLNRVNRLELEVEADNPIAIRVYGQMGFKIEGTKRGLIKRPEEKSYVNELFMAKQLGPTDF